MKEEEEERNLNYWHRRLLKPSRSARQQEMLF